MDKIMPFIDAPFVKVLTGVRRSGKSTILKMLQEELKKRGILGNRIIAYRFDSDEYADIDSSLKLYREIKSRLVEGKRSYIFLDEVQEIPSWEKAVNSLLNDFDVDIYVTGSNSRMMSSEISTYLTGRYVSFRILPLSFEEYLHFRQAYCQVGKQHDEFLRYLQMGGFPALQLRDYSLETAYAVVKDIYNSTIYTDIVRRNNIRKIDQLERIVRYVFDNVGNTFSAVSLSKFFKSQNRKIDLETVYNYLGYLEKAYIVQRCLRYDVRGKEILKTQEKFYLADSAFRFAVLGYNDNMIASTLENIVYTELIGRGYDVFVGKLENQEIDFIGVKAGEKIYLQIAQSLAGVEVRNREYGNLQVVDDNYPKYVLTLNELAGGNYEGIKTMHVADFLLSREY